MNTTADRHIRRTEEAIQRFCALRGEFGRSKFEENSVTVAVVALILMGSFLIGFAFRQWRNHSDVIPALVALVAALLCLAMGPILYHSRAGIRYRFEGGSLSEISRTGVVRWREPLDGMTNYIRRSARGSVTLRLQWPDRKRSIESMESLRRAMDEGPTPHATKKHGL